MNAKIDTQHTRLRVANGRVDISLLRAEKIKAYADEGYTWIDFRHGRDEVTVHLTEENLPQLKEAVRQIEQFYAKEVTV